MGVKADIFTDRLRKELPFVMERYGVKSLGIFGSYARGEGDSSSDLDILVEFDRKIDYFDFLDLEEYFESVLGIKIDLVERQSLKPYIGKRILEEVIIV